MLLDSLNGPYKLLTKYKGYLVSQGTCLDPKKFRLRRLGDQPNITKRLVWSQKTSQIAGMT